jgi:hypothetical protein|tara:strand:+ start:315 stop:938 length:624 start_codon:yes stop_codon:yes gene_type:complete
MKNIDNSDSIDLVVQKINSFSSEKVEKEEVMEVIFKISKIHRNKKFGYFSEEDIESQTLLICLQQLKFYEPEKATGTSPLNSVERWLNRVVKNRLANYYRDNYSSVNEKHRKTRVNLNNCLDIDSVNINVDKIKQLEKDPEYNLIYQEYKRFIEENLDEEMRQIYDACIEEENVSSYYKTKLNQEISSLNLLWLENFNNGKKTDESG